MAAPIIILPSARRLINSLRDIGYDLPTAVADLIDNSIGADATRVDVDLTFDGPESWIRVSDDGAGMGPTELDEAMRYGTQRGYERADLGRFGLGLKTASLSQCRRLTVASRQGAQRRRIAIRQWDLDRVARRNAWELLRPHADEVREEVVKPLDQGPGTVVLWEGLDRVLGHRAPDGAVARRALEAAAHDVRRHLAMVFHRFLAGEAHRRVPLGVTVNGEDVLPWDPFARGEAHTVALERQELALHTQGGRVTVTVRPYILPSQHRFSSAAAHAQAAGPRRWNRQQGLYFYRNDRLLQAGGWNRLRTSDEHTKLARVAVDIPPEADELFGVNVAKMRITIPGELRAGLTAIASGVAVRAAGSYRQHLLEGSPQGEAANGLDLTGRTGRPVPYARLVQVLRAEFADRPEMVRRILDRLESARMSAGVTGARADAGMAATPGQPFIITRRPRPRPAAAAVRD